MSRQDNQISMQNKQICFEKNTTRLAFVDSKADLNWFHICHLLEIAGVSAKLVRWQVQQPQWEELTSYVVTAFADFISLVDFFLGGIIMQRLDKCISLTSSSIPIVSFSMQKSIVSKCLTSLFYSFLIRLGPQNPIKNSQIDIRIEPPFFCFGGQTFCYFFRNF